MRYSSELTVTQVALRVIASFAGGYLFVLGLTTLGISLAIFLGTPYLEAQTLFYLLAFLVYVGVFCWSYVERNIIVVWLVLAGGGAAMTAFGWWLGQLSLA